MNVDRVVSRGQWDDLRLVPLERNRPTVDRDHRSGHDQHPLQKNELRGHVEPGGELRGRPRIGLLGLTGLWVSRLRWMTRLRIPLLGRMTRLRISRLRLAWLRIPLLGRMARLRMARLRGMPGLRIPRLRLAGVRRMPGLRWLSARRLSVPPLSTTVSLAVHGAHSSRSTPRSATENCLREQEATERSRLRACARR